MKVGSEDMAIHVVRSGETLWAISNFYGVSISSIVRDNGLMSIDSIVPGTCLIYSRKSDFTLSTLLSN